VSDDDIENWKLFCEGPNGQVWMHKDCMKEITKAKVPKMTAKILGDYMPERFCKFENLADLTHEQFNPNEGAHKVAGITIRMSAFKNYQLRVYGRLGSVHTVRAFFACGAEIKKKDLANPRAVKRCASRLDAIEAEIEGAKL
tara:strand:- start:986 stop:1411 length:426 start_codon:yes stop_codon:yes gene_type:complete